MELVKQVLFAFFACIASGVLFQLRRSKLVCAALGGALAWLIFALCSQWLHNDIACYFLATLAISLYSELMARRNRTPATVYLIVAILPLVPGGGLYLTMEYFIQGQTSLGIAQGLHTLGIAGALAIGIVLVSSTVRLILQFSFRRHMRRLGDHPKQRNS